MKLPENIISNVHIYADAALKLQPLINFIDNLVKCVELIIEYKYKINKNKININKDNNWINLGNNLEKGKKLKANQPISDAAKMYEELTNCLGLKNNNNHFKNKI